MNEGKNINRLDYKTRRKVDDFLHTIITVEDGFAVYADGWNDQKAASHMDVGERAVEYLRREMFGRLRKPPKTNGHSKEKAVELELQVRFLTDQVANLSKQVEAANERLTGIGQTVVNISMKLAPLLDT